LGLPIAPDPRIQIVSKKEIDRYDITQVGQKVSVCFYFLLKSFNSVLITNGNTVVGIFKM
jgi:hypothetical protein